MTTDLLVLNQSQSPAFQRMIEDASAPSTVCFLTGTPFPPSRDGARVEQGPPYDRTSLLRRGASWAAYSAWATARAALLNRPFILAVTNPPVMPHLAWTLSRLRGVRYGVLIWDIYPHHLVQMGWLREGSAGVRAWHAANRAVFKSAEFIVTLGEEMASTLQRELEGASRPSKLHVIPNWADTETLLPIPRADNPWATKLGVGDELVVLYSGNLGATHGLAGLLDAAQQLQSDARFRFIIIGDGLGRPAVQHKLQTAALKNVTLLDPVPWSEVRFTLALADVAVVSQAPGTEHLSVPSKTYSSLAVGSAILALTSSDTDLANLVTSHSVGSVTVGNDVESIVAALLGWVTDRETLSGTQRRARELALAEFSAERVTGLWSQLLAGSLADRAS